MTLTLASRFAGDNSDKGRDMGMVNKSLGFAYRLWVATTRQKNWMNEILQTGYPQRGNNLQRWYFAEKVYRF